MTKRELFEKCCGLINEQNPTLLKNASLIIREGKPQIIETRTLNASDRFMMKITKHDLTKGLTSKKWSYLDQLCYAITDET